MNFLTKRDGFDAGILANILILLVVATNAYTVAQHSHGEILSIGSYPAAQHILVLALLAVVAWTTASNPAKAIDTLFYLTILTGGMYIYRFAIFDELIASAALAGMIGARKLREYKRYGSVYYLFLLYILAMSVVGMIGLSEIRALRYVYISVLLLGIVYLAQRYKLQLGDEQSFHRTMLTAALMYELAYLVNALIILNYRPLETILGIGEAGAGYQGITFLFTMPSCFKIMGERGSFRIRAGAVIAILFATIVAVVADSRYVMLTILISFIFSIPRMSASIILSMLVAVVGVMSIFGFLYLDNAFIWFTLIADIFSQDVGASRTINYYGHDIETASGDQGRMLLFLNGFYYFMDGKLSILTGIGSYGYVHEAYKTYELLLGNLGIIDNVVNDSAFGTPPRPPSLAAYVVDYGLIFLGMLGLLWVSLVRKAFAIFRKRPEFMSYPINLVLFMAVGEQLDTIATYFLLLPVFGQYMRRQYTITK